MQGTHIELGGFRGRTNKLVDGCYSWWVGGCFLLVEGLLELEKGSQVIPENAEEKIKEAEHEAEWDEVDGTQL